MNLRPAATLGSITALVVGGLLLALPAHATTPTAPEPTPTLTAPQEVDQPVDAIRSWLLPDGGTPDHVTWPQTPVDPAACVPDHPGWIQQDFLHGLQSAIDHLNAPDSPAGANLAQGEDSPLYVRHVWVLQTVCAPQPTPTPTETPSAPSTPSPTATHTAPATPLPTQSPTPSSSPTAPATVSPTSHPSPTTTATPAGPSGPASSATAAAVTDDRPGINKVLADRSLAMTGSDTGPVKLLSSVLLAGGVLMLLIAYGPATIRRIRHRITANR